MLGERRFLVILGALRSTQHLWEYEAMQSGADTEVRLDMPKGLEIFCILVSTENVASLMGVFGRRRFKRIVSCGNAFLSPMASRCARTRWIAYSLGGSLTIR